VQGQLGLNQPLFGHIFDTEVYRSDVSLDHKRFHQLAIEGEFAFRMAEDVPDAGGWQLTPNTRSKQHLPSSSFTTFVAARRRENGLRS